MFINNFDPVAIEIFSFEIRWYSLAYIFGILLGWLYCKKKLINDKKILVLFDDLLAYLIIGIIIGGRIGYVIFYNPEYYIKNLPQISEELEKKGALQSAWFFRVGVRYQEKDTKLKAGSFLIPAFSTMQDISNIVTQGGANTCGTEIIYGVGIVSTTIRVRELDPKTSKLEEKFAFKSSDKRPAEFNSFLEDKSTRHRIVIAEGATSWRIVQALNKAKNK